MSTDFKVLEFRKVPERDEVDFQLIFKMLVFLFPRFGLAWDVLSIVLVS